MSRNNTGNPIDSKAFADFEDNVANFDQWSISDADSFKDRKGEERLTLRGTERAGAGDTSIAVDAAARAVAAAGQVEQDAEQIAQAAAQQAVDNVVIEVNGAVGRAESAASRAETASGAAFVNADVYPDIDAGLAATGVGDQFQVLSSDGLEYIRYRQDAGGVATRLPGGFPSASEVRLLKRNMVETVPGKNLLDKSRIRRGFYFSPGAGAIVAGSTYRCTGFIPVQPGRSYTISGNPVAERLSAFFSAESDTAYIAGSATHGSIATAPAGAAFMVSNVTSEGQDVLTYDSTMQIEAGITATAYESYRTTISESYLPASVARKNEILTDAVSENLFNPASITWTQRLAPSTGNIVNKDTNNLIATPPFRVSEGEWYSIGGVALPSSKTVGFFTSIDTLTAVATATFVAIDGGFKFQVPAGLGINWMRFNVFADVATSTINGTLQLNPGETLKDYTPYLEVRQILPELLPSSESGFVSRAELLETKSFNLLDPQAVDYSRRYSVASKAMIVDSVALVASDYIPVSEGEWYTVSGVDGVYGLSGGPSSCQGGYFAGEGLTAAIDNITFERPVAGSGASFLVPIGLGITHVVISLRPLNDVKPATELNGVVQLEVGEMATAYRPYLAEEKIKEKFLPVTSEGGSSGEFNSEQWYRYTEADDGHYLSSAFPSFRRHWIMRDKDLCVVNTGTSLTARSAEHCTDHPEAMLRPPLMHSNNMASILWDRLRWDRQEYRRYDYPGAFTESEAFSTSSNLPEWDDGIYRQGWTRYSQSASAAITFAVPAEAWQFNFIYRTDTTGVESNLLTVAEGSGQMEVYDDALGAWVEANGFTFSMRESAPVSRDIQVPRASTGEMVVRNIPSKGNTTYQKRLKMRCKNDAGLDSRSTEKTVSITAQSSGRFMYWGVEWSRREFMITYINAARGSHNTQADTVRGLPKWQDNEVWSFKPDLLFFELPIHNDGASGAASYTPGYWARLTDHFVFKEDYELSLKTRGAHFGLAPEIGMFTSSIAWNFGGITEDGKLKTGEELESGKILTALDKFNEACMWVWDNHPEAICINAAKRWVDAGEAIFGDLRTATEGSGKGGHTFTNEGSHWNDTGSKIIAKALVPLFDFTHP